MSSPSKVEIYGVVLDVLAELTAATGDYLEWASSPGDDDCPAETVDRLCKAQEEARDLIDGLGHGQTFS